jgi:hypothetical protein
LVCRVRNLLETAVAPLAPAEIFEENELGGHIAIVSWGEFRNGTFLLKLVRDAVQRLVGQFVRGAAVFSVKVMGQPPVHLEIPFAPGVNTSVQPLKEVTKCLLR